MWGGIVGYGGGYVTFVPSISVEKKNFGLIEIWKNNELVSR